MEMTQSATLPQGPSQHFHTRERTADFLNALLKKARREVREEVRKDESSSGSRQPAIALLFAGAALPYRCLCCTSP